MIGDYSLMATQLIGWLGSGLFLIAHAYLSFVADYNRRMYFSLNIIASLFLIVSSLFLMSLQPVVVNVFLLITSYFAWVDIKMSIRPSVSQLKFMMVVGAVFFIVTLFFFIGFTLIYLGWFSVVVFLSCYLSFSVGEITEYQYFKYNVFVSLSIIPQMYLDNNLPVVSLEFFWLLITVFGLRNIAKERARLVFNS